MEESFDEEICSGTTENAKVAEQETENANETSTTTQNSEYNETVYINTENFQPVELHNSAFLKQYIPGVKKPLSETQKQQNAQNAKHFLNDQLIKKKTQIEEKMTVRKIFCLISCGLQSPKNFVYPRIQNSRSISLKRNSSWAVQNMLSSSACNKLQWSFGYSLEWRTKHWRSNNAITRS